MFMFPLKNLARKGLSTLFTYTAEATHTIQHTQETSHRTSRPKFHNTKLLTFLDAAYH